MASVASFGWQASTLRFDDDSDLLFRALPFD
jgi:hypothetical protein